MAEIVQIRQADGRPARPMAWGLLMVVSDCLALAGTGTGKFEAGGLSDVAYRSICDVACECICTRWDDVPGDESSRWRDR